MKKVAQMTPKEAIAKIKKFDREHKGCSQLPIIMRIDHKAKKEDNVTASDLCYLYGAVHSYGWQWEKDIMPRFWHYGIDLDIGDDLLRIQILKIPGSKTEPNVAKRKWTTLKPEEVGIYGAKYTKAYIDLRPGGRVYFEDGTCQPISKADFPYFNQTTKGMRRLISSAYSYRFPLPRDKALEIWNLLVNTYKKVAPGWVCSQVAGGNMYNGWLVKLAASQQYSDVQPKGETDREKEINAMRKLIDVNKILSSCGPEELYMRSEKIGKVYMFYWSETVGRYTRGDYINKQLVYVTFINGKKATSFSIDRNEKTVEYVQNQDVSVSPEIRMHGAIQIFKDHPKLSWVAELPCFSYIRPHQIPALEKAYPAEQFVKMGLPYAAEGCLYIGSFTTNRSNRGFGLDYLKENTSVLKAYGISKKQAEYIDEKLHRTAFLHPDNRYRGSYLSQGTTESIVLILRRMFGVEELSKRLSNDFDIFVDWLYGDDDYPSNPYWNDRDILEHPDTQKYKNLVRIIKMYVQELRKPHTKGSLNYFKDTINMWMCDNHWNTEGFYGPNGIASTLRTPHDFQVLHDHLVEVRNARNNQRGGYYDRQRTLAEQAEFERKAKKALELLRENYEYIGESFRIVVPMTGAEITNEGQMLHHCVGGYATRHLERSTTILFLRTNETPDKSYYTIEVRGIGDGPYVVQIHGFGNKWIGNDPDAMRFAYHYFIDHNIRCDKSILLCTGKSYGGGNEALPESELY